MRRISFLCLAVLMSALFLAGGCSKTSALEIGEEAVDFTLRDVNGKTVNLSDFKGKVIILDFFASWCPPCRQEIPDFIDLQKAYGDKGFTMVGVSLVEPGEAKSFADKMGINYPVVVDDNRVSVLYGPMRSIPTTFVIGKDFRIARMYIGYRPKNVFESDVKALLK
ncbi:MAG: TlpA family protein disulfide reductase [Candidatus Omnitrophica bacterium]|nr:TlpA family protein disulfide reductase [Candidatus Omnitrophota bacterium]